MEVVSCKVADSKSTNYFVDGLRRKIFYSHGSIRHNVVQWFLEVSNSLAQMFERAAVSLQEDIRDAICSAARDVRRLSCCNWSW